MSQISEDVIPYSDTAHIVDFTPAQGALARPIDSHKRFSLRVDLSQEVSQVWKDSFTLPFEINALRRCGDIPTLEWHRDFLILHGVFPFQIKDNTLPEVVREAAAIARERAAEAQTEYEASRPAENAAKAEIEELLRDTHGEDR